MMTVYKNGAVFIDGGFSITDILERDGNIVDIGTSLSGDATVDLKDLFVFPGFADVHVHFREPGFSHKETIKTGALAAASAGCCAVCTMPNLDPVPDSAEALGIQTEIIRRDARIKVVPFAAITRQRKGTELSDMAQLAPFVAGFSDDGSGVQSDAVMRAAMLKAKELGAIIAAHCEDEKYPASDARSEWKQLERDIALVRETGCRYHACHISCRESVELICAAKREKLDVTCETAPHYLLFDRDMIDDSPKYRMNPPIRSRADREALVNAALDGTIDMLATDHAPHTDAEKLAGMNGVVGLETAFSALYTSGILPLPRLIDMMSAAPKSRFGLGGGIAIGAACDICIWDLSRTWTVDRRRFKSKSGMSPFEYMKLNGKCVKNIVGGKLIYAEDAKNA